MKAHVLTANDLALLTPGDARVEIVNGAQIRIVTDSEQVTLVALRNAREVAYMLCEAADELERHPWDERERAWRRGKGWP